MSINVKSRENKTQQQNKLIFKNLLQNKVHVQDRDLEVVRGG